MVELFGWSQFLKKHLPFDTPWPLLNKLMNRHTWLADPCYWTVTIHINLAPTWKFHRVCLGVSLTFCREDARSMPFVQILWSALQFDLQRNLSMTPRIRKDVWWKLLKGHTIGSGGICHPAVSTSCSNLLLLGWTGWGTRTRKGWVHSYWESMQKSLRFF